MIFSKALNMKLGLVALTVITFCFTPSQGVAKCSATDKLCVMAEIKKTADSIENISWREKSYSDLARSYTNAGHESKAVALIDEITKPAMKATTIHIIGESAAKSKWQDKKRYQALFEKLAKKADKIEHKPSYAIAYTYIAMAQASSGDNKGAMATAQNMGNDALRHKAFAEISEIQAKRRNFDAAMASIKEIESSSYRNKAYGSVSRIFLKKGELESAYTAAEKIDNPYARAQALQNLINHDHSKDAKPAS